MVYIYKKVIGNKEYYYLRVSEKKGNKLVTKDLAYLGSSIEEVKKALDNLPQYKEKIRKTYKTIHNFLESNRYIEKIKNLKLKQDLFLGDKLSEIEACKLHYNQEFKKQDLNTRQEILKNVKAIREALTDYPKNDCPEVRESLKEIEELAEKIRVWQ